MRITILFVTLFLALTLAIPVKVGSEVSVGGLSSGAFMAVQMHFAHSETIKGAAVFAGGPYYCAEGQMVKALTTCMSMGTGINISGIQSKISSYESSGAIDSTSNLNGSKVFVFAGTSDYTVNPKVDKAAEELYSKYGVDLVDKFDLVAGHTMPTTKYGNICSVTQSPFIGKCDYNGALESLKHLHGDHITEKSMEVKSSNLFKIKQNTSGTVMGSEAYVYAPEACQSEGAECPLHVVFHGCKQTIKDIGTKYVEETGYNEVAEDNNMVILYPQATSSMLSNPNGCWDWWGYTNGDYANQKGKQISEVFRLITGLQQGTMEMTRVYQTESVVEDTLKGISS